MWPMLARWLTLRRFLTRGFTINTGPTPRVSPWIFVIGGGKKAGEDCILFLMFCSSRARLSCPLFSACQTKREERWRGRVPGGEERRGGGLGGGEGGGWGGAEGLLTCTCLQSLRMHCTIHLLCLYCHGWGQSDQTPIRYLILHTPPSSTPRLLSPCTPPPLPPSSSPNTVFFFFSCDMLTEGGKAIHKHPPQMGENVRKGTHIKTMLSWWYSMVQNLQTSTQPLAGCSVYKHTHTQVFMCAEKINTVAFLSFFFCCCCFSLDKRKTINNKYRRTDGEMRRAFVSPGWSFPPCPKFHPSIQNFK